LSRNQSLKIKLGKAHLPGVCAFVTVFFVVWRLAARDA
jgi:hypothetical protein